MPGVGGVSCLGLVGVGSARVLPAVGFNAFRARCRQLLPEAAGVAAAAVAAAAGGPSAARDVEPLILIGRRNRRRFGRLIPAGCRGAGALCTHVE